MKYIRVNEMTIDDLTLATFRVSKTIWDQFQIKCKQNNSTATQQLRSYISSYLDDSLSNNLDTDLDNNLDER